MGANVGQAVDIGRFGIVEVAGNPIARLVVGNFVENLMGLFLGSGVDAVLRLGFGIEKTVEVVGVDRFGTGLGRGLDFGPDTGLDFGLRMWLDFESDIGLDVEPDTGHGFEPGRGVESDTAHGFDSENEPDIELGIGFADEFVGES